MSYWGSKSSRTFWIFLSQRKVGVERQWLLWIAALFTIFYPDPQRALIKNRCLVCKRPSSPQAIKKQRVNLFFDAHKNPQQKQDVKKCSERKRSINLFTGRGLQLAVCRLYSCRLGSRKKMHLKVAGQRITESLPVLSTADC